MQAEILELVIKAISAEYGNLMPDGFTVYRVDEYTQEKYPAPNLWFEKSREVPGAKYIVILTDDVSSVPALGETVNHAMKRAIAKIEARNSAAAH